jgi:single-stranded-DNA-specific exonuclease
MPKQWNIKARTEKNIVDQLLLNRGVDPHDPEAVEVFLHPKYEAAFDPFLFKEMKTATDRIWKGIEAKEKFYIYSDYDADAVTAATVVYRGLKFLGIECEVYIPDRFSEGYGLNLEAFQKIKDSGATVVITVDCGTNSTAEADFCRANGIDLIITDHHEVTGEIPDAYALINPKRPGETYPYHELVGVGVAFKLITAVYKDPRCTLAPGYEKWLLDLVAIGTVADCHSLLGENRILVSYGIQVLKKTKWLGLKALLQLAGVAPHEINAKTLGFTLAPRINAAGRLEHASGAFNLLIADDPLQASAAAAALDAVNKKRQMLTETVMSEARAQIELVQHRAVLMVHGTDWPKGVVGLVAGKIADEYAKPVFVMERGEEFSTGSARSIPEFNVVDALIYSKDLLVKYGGHAAAAGFTVRTEHIEKFYESLLRFADSVMVESELETDALQESEKPTGKILEAEAELNSDELNIQTAELIDCLEPFGKDNERPKFIVRNVTLESMAAVGKEQQHAQISITAGGRKVKGIAFSMAKSFSHFIPGEHLDVLGELMVDTWQGMKTLKLRIVDMRPAMTAE